ncbi:hypothetical protein NEIFLAOT_01092 [Neisseria flavescens NRL30031/H210]|uniref:Uncharacterized protein n=1 Tax=Neisseria flavescens NRL30031/H210 TaxID=546264 RepID=C0EMC1_NEIFL|nr:hypothetical protein NEIFLAOT_01092 [Neisseria flavescens NRL30031/H210]
MKCRLKIFMFSDGIFLKRLILSITETAKIKMDKFLVRNFY